MGIGRVGEIIRLFGKAHVHSQSTNDVLKIARLNRGFAGVADGSAAESVRLESEDSWPW